MAKKRTTRKRTDSNGTSKAQAIRDTAKELGKKARPRDIVAALAAKGITVASAQVSTTLKAAGMRRGRRRKKEATAKEVAKNGRSHALSIADLFKVRELATKLGGTSK